MQLVKGAARFCQMPLFWRFLRTVAGEEINGEPDAAAFVRRWCGVVSRAELAQNDEGRKRFIDLVNRFNDFMRGDK